jgi:predicted NBD/HSP70 family sugar kinase
MEHVGIDLGGRESQVCIRTAEGTILLERRMRTATLKSTVFPSPRLTLLGTEIPERVG